ncbi:MAG: tetratricopeptide repeat protein [Chloroflexi bacterium]|nr:tetratricopeptide repeat protein [Chloroflexota bacterium]
MKSWTFLLLSLLFLACASPVAEQTSLAERARMLPGRHITFVADAPDGYEKLSIEAIVGLPPKVEDIWLYAPKDALERQPQQALLRTWLEAREAEPLSDGSETIFWLPTRIDADAFVALQEAGLLEALPTKTQAFLWQLRGDRLRIDQDFEAAIAAYERALELDLANVEANAGLGAAWLGLGRSDKAAPPLQRAVALDPNHYWAHRLLGSAYLNLQRYALAADEFAQAYIIRPQDAQLLLPLALGLGRSGQRELALQILEQFLALNDDPKLRGDAEALRREFGGL